MSEELCFLPAWEAAELMCSRHLSPVELVQAVIDRVETFDPDLNAFAHFAPESAMDSARAAEAAILRGENRPLLGVPVTIKDHVDVDGMPTRSGSTLTSEAAARFDNPLVTRLRKAGAIVLGKTTTSEFGWKAISDSPLHGITHNPWRRGYNAGASSAGAAAAAAAGFGPLHLGSDGAGSVRLPAHFCGLYGLKPTYGRIPLIPQMKGDHVVHFGPLTRGVEDAALMLDVMAGAHWRDPMSLRAESESYMTALAEPVRRIRIAYSADLGHARVDSEVAAIVQEAVRKIAAHPKVEVEDVTPSWGGEGAEIQRILWPAHQVHHYANVEQYGDRMDQALVACVEDSRALSLSDYDAVRTRKHSYVAEQNAFFESWDFLLTPAASVAAFPAHLLQPEHWQPERWDWMKWAEFSYPFNLSGNPAASIHCGFTAGGLPVGLQIAGRRFDDRGVLQMSMLAQGMEIAPTVRPRLEDGRTSSR